MADVPHNDAGFLIPMAAVTFPMGTKELDSQGYEFLVIVCGDWQMGSAVDVVLGNVRTETAGVGKHGDGLAHGALFLELAGALGCKVGYGFLHLAELVQSL